MIRPLALAFAAVLALGACDLDRGSKSGDGVKVATTLYPTTFLVERIGGPRIGLVELQPRGADAHDLELTSGQVREIADADLIVYAGEGFQPAVEDAVADHSDERRFDILAGRAEPVDEGEDDHEGKDDHAGEDGHAEMAVDPHIWLSLRLFPGVVQDLVDHLTEIDPAGADTYRDNATALMADLSDLDDEYQRGLADCERREIVVAHSAFGYLSDRYDLEEVAFAGIDPEAEPSPARLAEVTEFARDNGVTTIFFEEQTSPAAAQTVARELGLETSVLDPLETRPDEGDYLDAMRSNLTNLRTALGCF